MAPFAGRFSVGSYLLQCWRQSPCMVNGPLAELENGYPWLWCSGCVPEVLSRANWTDQTTIRPNRSFDLAHCGITTNDLPAYSISERWGTTFKRVPRAREYNRALLRQTDVGW